MRILAVDHDEKELARILSVINEHEPDAKTVGAKSFKEASALADENLFDLVFIDPDSKEKMTAEDFGLKLKAKCKDTHIIFTSKTKKYMPEAFAVRADSYLIKPVTLENVAKEIDYLMNNYPQPLRPLEIVVRTFGGFNVYYRGRRLLFKRSKSKELLAILVDNRGSGLTTREACAMLFDGRKYDEITLGYFHVVLTSLKTTLEEYGIKNLVRKSVNYIALNPDMLDCDMYRYLKGEPEAVRDYHGDYMACYSWAEYTGGSFAADDNKGELNAG